MDSIPKTVLRNPYRILGVYANSRRQEILANKSKATAFLKVGKTIEYPLDLKGIVPPVNRTLEMFNEAEAHLAIAKEQICYAQFWFLRATTLDDVAFNHLIAGDMAGAKEYLKTENVKIEHEKRHFATISQSTVKYDIVRDYKEFRDVITSE